MQLGERLSRIWKFIHNEGLLHYARRILYGGIYLHYAYRSMRSGRLSTNPIQLFGKEFFLSARPQGLTEELQIYGVHEPLASRMYTNTIKGEEVILDIGSNVGYYALLATVCTENAGEIHCFEPDRELCEVLAKNRVAAQANWKISPIAVSDKKGEIDFYRSHVANWGGIREKYVSEKMEAVKVGSTTVDDYCRSERIVPTILRMDIEGAELEAIRGARRTLRNHRPKIFMEFHRSFLSEREIFEMKGDLLEAGYSRAIVIKRYYDTPWAMKFDRKFIEKDARVEDIFKQARKRDDGVVSLFLAPGGRE